MPISSSAAAIEKKKIFHIKNKSLTPNSDHHNQKSKESSSNVARSIQRSHSTLSSVDVTKNNAPVEPIVLQTQSDGTVRLSRSQKEKEKNPDRICLDRRGLTCVPAIDGESRLRLLSMQHNLINSLDQLRSRDFPYLVFLDVYDNQLERMHNLEPLENLRVLLMGKNRIKRIEGLENLRRLEVLDLHGNQIAQVSGLNSAALLKVLNLAGNQVKTIGTNDFKGLNALNELNLRRNRLRKLLGFGDTPNLEKLFVSSNEILSVEDISSLAKSTNIKELSIENNPVSLAGDCASFLISYLPKLVTLNSMQITDQVRKAAMAWRRNKESSSSTYMDLTSDVTQNVRREEVISNARTNWELLRSQTKCLATSCSSNVGKTLNPKPDADIILTSLGKRENKNNLPIRTKSFFKGAILPDKKLNVTRSNSQDTENSSSNQSGGDYFRLPPILVPIINKLEQKEAREVACKDNVSSVGPNLDSSVSSMNSDSEEQSDSSEVADSEAKSNPANLKSLDINSNENGNSDCPSMGSAIQLPDMIVSSDNNTETSSNLSSNTSATPSSNNESEALQSKSSIKSRRSVKSAVNHRVTSSKIRNRAATAKPNKPASPVTNQPVLVREREQGGDYLIEICGRHLNIYGQAALRFIDKTWCTAKANDVNTVNFNYANFNHISGVLSKVKPRFPHAESFVFKETNIYCLGQLNALSELQGLSSITIGKEGNPINEKDWISYAIFRLSHWGLKTINGKIISQEEIEDANSQYQSLSDLVLWSLPDALLHPLLVKLRIDVNNPETEVNPKKWLMSSDPALKSVVSKEALQWKKSASTQEDLMMRQRARCYMTKLLQETCNTVNKLRLFDERWPAILQDIVRNALFDYSQLELYMKRKLSELK